MSDRQSTASTNARDIEAFSPRLILKSLGIARERVVPDLVPELGGQLKQGGWQHIYGRDGAVAGKEAVLKVATAFEETESVVLQWRYRGFASSD